MITQTQKPMLLRKFVAPEFVYGEDARKLAGRYAHNLGAKKVLLVSDAVVNEKGWVKDVEESLLEADLSYTLFLDVSPNPRAHEVMKGSEQYVLSECDLIVAIGGGSVMDCAKGIGIVSTNGGNILDYEGVDKIILPMPPLICIPTTAGTSADVSQFAIINDFEQKVKIAIISKAVVPDVALIDPLTLTTMDNYLTACTGIDALVHAVEAYVSSASSSFTDMHAKEAIGLVLEYLPLSIASPQDVTLRTQVMKGSLHAGLAFSNASLGTVHAMAHSLGGYLDLPHGECNALLLPHVMSYNYASANEKYKALAGMMNISFKGIPDSKVRDAITRYIIDFRKEVGIAETLSAKGVSGSDIPILSAHAINDPCNATNPRQPNKEDIGVIFHEAM